MSIKFAGYVTGLNIPQILNFKEKFNVLRMLRLYSSRYRRARKVQTAVGLTAVAAILSKESTLVPNRASFEYSYSIGFIRTNRATVLL